MERKQPCQTILPSGHASVSVTEFANGVRELPREAQVRGISKGDFEIHSSPSTQFCAAAMIKISNSRENDHFNISSHGGSSAAFAGHAGVSLHGRIREHGPSSQGMCRMENGGGKKMLELILKFQEQITKEARESIGMGQGWPAIGLPSGFQPVVFPPNVPPLPTFPGHINKQGRVGGDAEVWGTNCPMQMQDAPTSASLCMPSSKGMSLWGSQPVPEGSMVSGLPLKMESGNCTQSICRHH